MITRLLVAKGIHVRSGVGQEATHRPNTIKAWATRESFASTLVKINLVRSLKEYKRQTSQKKSALKN